MKWLDSLGFIAVAAGKLGVSLAPRSGVECPGFDALRRLRPWYDRHWLGEVTAAEARRAGIPHAERAERGNESESDAHLFAIRVPESLAWKSAPGGLPRPTASAP
jgi:hypothetical protein